MGKNLLGCGFVLLSFAVGCGGSSGASDDESGSGGKSGGGGSGGSTGGSGGSTGGSGGSTGGSGGSTGGSGGATGGSGGSSAGKGGSGGGGAGMSAGIPLESLPTSIATSACKLLFQCCTTAQRDANPFVGGTEAECRSNYTALFTLVIPEMNQSIAQGRMRYDGVALEACLATFEAAGCSGTLDDPMECDGVFNPLVEVGGGCTQQGECIDSACLGGDSTNDVDGVCGAPVANGTDCTDDEECASGYCSGLTCEPKVANGEVCFVDSECVSDFCDPNGVCAAGTSELCE